MLSLQNILGTKGQEFLDNLLNKEVVVTEKLNAATLSFQKKQKSEMDLNRKLTFYKGSGTNKKEITIADRVMTTFYSTGMTYINNLSDIIIDRIPANWTFVCKYFPNHQPSFINYSVLPKNNLVLSCIITSGGTRLEDSDDLRNWAEIFDIAYQEPVYFHITPVDIFLRAYLLIHWHGQQWGECKIYSSEMIGINSYKIFRRFIKTKVPKLPGIHIHVLILHVISYYNVDHP